MSILRSWTRDLVEIMEICWCVLCKVKVVRGGDGGRVGCVLRTWSTLHEVEVAAQYQ